MPVFFISPDHNLGEEIRISGPLSHHLRKSLRVRVGENLWLGEDARRRFLVQIIDDTRGEFLCRILQEQAAPVHTGPRIVLGCALLKGDRMDWVFQKATELGVDAIVPLETQYTVVQIKSERVSVQLRRWQRIALEAAQQAERWDIPRVEAPTSAAVFFEQWGRGCMNVILSARETELRLATVSLPKERRDTINLAVGPEGGWEDAERQTAGANGFQAVSLGPRILRAETAVVAALSVIQSRLGEL